MILVYLYFLMSNSRSLCQIPLIIILFPFNYIVGLLFIIPLGTSLGTPYYPPYVHYTSSTKSTSTRLREGAYCKVISMVYSTIVSCHCKFLPRKVCLSPCQQSSNAINVNLNNKSILFHQCSSMDTLAQ